MRMNAERYFEVIFEDADLLVLNKPAGLVCHPSKGSVYSSLIGRARAHLGPRTSLHLVNRLDRETSGVILLAKSPATAGELGKIWERHGAEKEYLAIVHGHVQEDTGVIDAPRAHLTRSRDTGAPTTLPDRVALRTHRETFNRRYEPQILSSGPVALSYGMTPAGDVGSLIEGTTARSFQYDFLDRLVASPDWLSYGNDNNGNRTSETVDGKTTIVTRMTEIVRDYALVPQDNYYRSAEHVTNTTITGFNFDHPDRLAVKFHRAAGNIGVADDQGGIGSAGIYFAPLAAGILRGKHHRVSLGSQNGDDSSHGSEGYVCAHAYLHPIQDSEANVSRHEQI